MSLASIGDVKLFPATLTLLDSILKTLDSYGSFNDRTIETFMNQSRVEFESIFGKIEQFTGINFKINFSFAVAALLIKGFRNPSTKFMTSNIMATFLDISAKRSAVTKVLGYLVPLLPSKEAANILQTLKLTINPQEADADCTYLLSKGYIPDNVNAALFVTMLVTFLEYAEYEQEQLNIYDLIKKAIDFMPHVFPAIFDNLIKKMNQVIGNSQNEAILILVTSILKAMVDNKDYKSENSEFNRLYLSQIGFQGFTEHGSFNNMTQQKKDGSAALCAQLLQAMVKQSKP